MVTAVTDVETIEQLPLSCYHFLQYLT